ncbi:MAG: T9SS type A sorting domain-containing protein [Flavobacterium sp.]|nr:T9SS type A sorting domain-containing protein [Flavobacterium sp.]
MLNKIYCFLALLCTILSQAQDPMDVVQTYGPYPGFNDKVTDIAIQPDGKSIYVGWFTEYRGNLCNHIVRLNVDGSIDTSFLVGIGLNGSNYGTYTVTLQTDGKILVGGTFSTYQTIPVHSIIRLNPDGSLENGFLGLSNLYFGSSVQNILILPNGKIIIDGYGSNKILRINSDGSVDNSFEIGTGFNYGITKILAQSDGKLIVVGRFTTFNGLSRNRIIRLNEDGSKDDSFSIGIGFDSDINDAVIQPDGKVVVCGSFGLYKGINQKKLARLLPNGDLDSSFNTGTSFPNGTSSLDPQLPQKIEIDSNGSLIIIGTFTSYNESPKFGFVKLNSDGSIDANCNFTTNNNYLYSIAVGYDDNIIVGGIRKIYRILSNGNQDVSLSYGTGFNSRIYDTQSRPNGKYLVAGQFSEYQEETNIVVQFNSDGTKDNTFIFNNGLGYIHGLIKSILVLPNEQILVGGSFAINVNGTTYSNLIRVNTDGSVDTSFNPPYINNGMIHALAAQPDGKIMVGGSFTYINNLLDPYLMRLNSNGTRDYTFDKGTGFGTEGFALNVASIVIQPDDKILIGGNFFVYRNEPHNHLMRLMPNGSVDSSFNTGDGFNFFIEKIMLQPDNKIVAAGHIGSFDSQSVWGIARLNPNGSLDTSFTTGFTTDYINDFTIQPDGKIITVGYTSYFVGNPLSNLVRFNPDGTTDTSFNPNDYLRSKDLYSVSLFNNGNILLGGDFNTFNGYNTSKLILLRGGDAPLSSASFSQQNMIIYPNPTKENITILISDSSDSSTFSYKITDVSGKTVLENKSLLSSINVESLSNGVYFIKVSNGEGNYIAKFIKN